MALVTVLSFFSCSSPRFDARISLESDAYANLVLKVYVEGSDGDSVTGSLVLVVTPSYETLLLDYNESKGCYTGSLSGAESGTYHLTIRSYMSKDPFELEVPHAVLITRPIISGVSGVDGTNGLTGYPLATDEGITVSWNVVPEASAYRLEVRKDGVVVYAASCRDTAFLIPEGSIKATGTIGLSVLAQYQAGDPFFLEASYSSVSTAAGPNVYITVQ